MANIGSLTATMGIDISGLSKAEKAMSGFIGRTKAAFKAISPFLGFTIAAGIAIGLKNLGAQAVLFEKEMSNVKAIAGATGEEFQRLEDRAKSLGETTIFTAKEAAEGMSFLAMAGFKTTEIIGAMPGVLQLASAATIDLGSAADITSNILKGYGMEVSDLSHVNDVLVKAFTSANVNLSMLGQSMKFVGPVARSAGVAFEEAAAAAALLGNAGIQGTMAGTSLRNAISRLIGPSTKAAKVLEDIGIEAVDIDGKFAGLANVVEQFEKGLEGVSGEAERTAILLEVFGLRAGPAMSVLIETGSKAIREFTDELNNAGGIAQRIADEKIKNLAGAWAILKSAITGVVIYMSDTAFPVLSNLFLMLARNVGIVKDLWSAFTAFPSAIFDQLERMEKQLGKTEEAVNKLKGALAIDPLDLYDKSAWVMWGQNFFTVVEYILSSIGRTLTFTLKSIWDLTGSALSAVVGLSKNLTAVLHGLFTMTRKEYAIMLEEQKEKFHKAWADMVENQVLNNKNLVSAVLSDFDAMISKMEERMRGADLSVTTTFFTPETMKKIEDETKRFENLAEKIRLAKEGDAALNAILLEQYKNLLQVGTMVWQSVLTAEEAYRLKVAELNKLLAENVISHETYARAVIQSHEQMIVS
ncbi:hypothetical protein LCGC14_0717730, partial [marine sediment metagenome]